MSKMALVCNINVSICSSHNFHNRSLDIHISYKPSITSSDDEPNALLSFNSDSALATRRSNSWMGKSLEMIISLSTQIWMGKSYKQ